MEHTNPSMVAKTNKGGRTMSDGRKDYIMDAHDIARETLIRYENFRREFTEMNPTASAGAIGIAFLATPDAKLLMLSLDVDAIATSSMDDE